MVLGGGVASCLLVACCHSLHWPGPSQHGKPGDHLRTQRSSGARGQETLLLAEAARQRPMRSPPGAGRKGRSVSPLVFFVIFYSAARMHALLFSGFLGNLGSLFVLFFAHTPWFLDFFSLFFVCVCLVFSLVGIAGLYLAVVIC